MFRKISHSLFASTLAATMLLVGAGCENDKEILDIETPAGEIEVEQDRDTGKIEVEVEEE